MKRLFQVVMVVFIYTGYAKSDEVLPSQLQIKTQTSVDEERGFTFYGGHLASGTGSIKFHGTRYPEICGKLPTIILL